MNIYQIRRGLDVEVDVDTELFIREDTTDSFIYRDIKEKLEVTKEFIDTYRARWDGAKKQINEYEYIYTSTNPKKNICSVVPISRSYFKLREIMYDLRLTCDDNIACVAEAPGGFIQSLLDMFHYRIHKISAITLLSENKDIPYWNNSLLVHEKVFLSSGNDNTGNLYKAKNLLHFINEVKKSSCSLVTADGGFDYSENFNNQEYLSYQLIYSEVFLALSLLKEGGTFICKIFDIFTIHTLQLIYLLYQSFNEIMFIKPVTSRLTNSEKYIICKGYKGYNKDKSNLMFSLLLQDKIYELSLDIPLSFYNEIQKYNLSFTNEQIQIIQKAIYHAKSRNISHHPTYKQIKSGKAWCKKYELPINELFR